MKMKKFRLGIFEAALWILSLIILIPLAAILINSVKTPAETNVLTLALPETWEFGNFSRIFRETNVVRSFFNSTLVTVASIVLSVFLGTIAGYVLSRNMDFWNKKNEYFRFHGDYLVHTLEDEILLPILTAMERKCQILLTVKSTRSRRAGDVAITPLRILTSTQTGRRYVCGRRQDSHRFTSFRLDSIQNARILEPDPCFDRYMETFADTFPYIWGVSFGNLRKPETVTMEICFDEKEESYILTRLDREGRCGALKRLEPGVYEYRRLCLDPSELLPWAKSFTGRVRSFHCSDRAVEKRFWDDMNLMEACYLPSDAVPD